MNFEMSEDQAALVDSLVKLLDHEATAHASHDGERSFFNAEVDRRIEEEGFFDAGTHVDFGSVAPALVVDEISSRPIIVEAASSSFVRPVVCPSWPRPLAVIVGDINRPARFLCEAQSVLFLGEADARIASLSEHEREAVIPFFTYPMGRLKNAEACFKQSEIVAPAGQVKQLLLLSIASEIGGTLQGALNSVNEHVKNRRQFGRPLGSFQAIQHRLASNATSILAGKWLTRKAAAAGDLTSVLTAVSYLQDCTTQVLYDLHQFMGAMGLTLEHPLYRWSYRAKLLKSELGGASRQMRDLAAIAWPEAR